MNYYQNKQLVYVNSYFRTNDSSTTSDFSVVLNINQNIEFDTVCVLDCVVPKTHHLIRQSINNTFVVVEETGDRIITMPYGNYNRRSFSLVLTGLLNIGTPVYTITYDNINIKNDTGRFYFTCNTLFQPSFIFSNSLGSIMGFLNNSTNVFVDNNLVSVNVMNFKLRDTYFITSDICHSDGSTILAHITGYSTDNNSYINFVNTNVIEYSRAYSHNKSNVYKFQITDENFNVINTHGADCLITLILYKKNNIDSLIKSFIKHQVLIQK